jgi:type I restriction enzyme S subunit
MEATLIKNFTIDKTNWVPVKFGDVVAEPRDTVKNIVSEGIEHVVGLEHIETENIHLRNSAGIEESTTFTKKFAKGDVLFGRRRAYLKKAAQASFNGICSGDITVLRTTKGLLPELLPFIVNNDKFFDHAIKHSAGGLSPRVKFKDLANYEFLLPPNDEQAQLAELLWTMDEVIEKEVEVLSKTTIFFETSRNSIYSSYFSDHPLAILNDANFSENRFEKYFKVKTVNGIYKSKEFLGKGVRIINMGELFAYPIIKDQEMALIQLTSNEKKQFLVEDGDLIFARRSLVVEGAGKCSIIGEHTTPMTFESSMIRARVDKYKIQPKYVFHFLKSKEGRKRIRRIVGYTTVAGITSSDLAKVRVPIVSFERQNEILYFLEQFEQIFTSINCKISSSKALQKSLINQIF